MTEQEWRDSYKRGGIAVCQSPSWLLKGCPKCGCKSWQVTSDCWAYCDECHKGYPTAYPFTSLWSILSSLTEDGVKDWEEVHDE